MATSDLARRLRFGPFPKLRRAAHRGGGAGPRAAAARVELSPAIAVLQWALAAISTLAIWLVAFALVFSRLQEHRAQHTLYAEFREKLALQTARIGADANGNPIPVGEPVAIVNSPAGHLSNLVVVEGTAAAQTRSGPGHRRDSVLPGQAGVSVLYGRSVMFGAPFAGITQLRPGDEIWAVTGQGRFLYHVTDVRRAGDPLPQPLAAGGSQLSLVTSDSPGWRSGWAPTGTVYVDATLVEPQTAAQSPGHVSAVPDEESSMHGDTSSLIPTIFWLQALLLASLGIVWAWRRWGAWQTWIVATIVMVALLWGASGSAALLLPNLI